MNLKAMLVKSFAVAAFTLSGAALLNTVNMNAAHAATISNDVSVVTVKANNLGYVTVYNNYAAPAATGQTLKPNSHWKVIKTALDGYGRKWYDLGKNQWVKATDVANGWYTSTTYVAPAAQTTHHTQQANQNTQQNTQTTQHTQQANQNTQQNTQTTQQQTTTQTTQTSQNNTAASQNTGSNSDAAAKAWIANRESGGSYTARNGQYIGKYQLSSSMLNGNYSAANQEQVANNYVNSRYGSWSAAQSFWQANGWY
ncbi:MAG: hypothetical protein ACTIAG_02375 [Lactobacillus sp.]